MVHEEGQCFQFTGCVWAEKEKSPFVYEIRWAMTKGSNPSLQDLSFFGMKQGNDEKQCSILGFSVAAVTH